MATKSSAKKVNGPAERLRGLQFITLGVFVILALAAGYLMKNASYQITIGHLTNDVLASKSSTVFAPAVSALFDLNLRWWLVVFMLLSSLFPLLRLTKWRQRYADGVSQGYLGGRWLDYSLTFGLLVATLALLNGVNQLLVLVVLALITAGGFLQSRLCERQAFEKNADATRTWKRARLVSMLPWAYIVVTMLATLLYSTIRSPWYVYAVVITTLLAFVAFGWNQLNQLRAYKSWKNYSVVERNYTLINLFAKASFAVILIIGLHR